MYLGFHRQEGRSLFGFCKAAGPARGAQGAGCGVAAPPRKGRRKAEGGVSQCAGAEWQEASSFRLRSRQACPTGESWGGTAHHPQMNPPEAGKRRWTLIGRLRREQRDGNGQRGSPRLRSGQAYRTATAERLFTALRGGYSGQAPAQRAQRTAGGGVR